ncbi:hypothetical protein DPMN_042376 [Dreissena polymorpha]|uniref:Uncharacterized protein n=1 Tax=Dreissena polymorpha TaxID=45954 RepID=A0A9D4HX02_DREPO|nr:hypothetical protein DPMN_042376 [Dreissena polymorpha]
MSEHCLTSAPHYHWDNFLLTTFHKEWTINVASRVKNAQHPGGHVFQATATIFEDKSKFHEEWTINVASKEKNDLPLLRPCFSSSWNHFKLIQDIIGKNLLTKFHEDWAINVASSVEGKC